MEKERIQRLDTFLRETNGIVNKRPYNLRRCVNSAFDYSNRNSNFLSIFGFGPETPFIFKPINELVENFRYTADVSSEDLDFLVQKEAVLVKTPDDLAREFNKKPEDYIGICEKYASLLSQYSTLKYEIESLNGQLSVLKKIFSGKRIITERRGSLSDKQGMLIDVESSIKDLEKDTLFQAIKEFVNTNQGVYVKPYIDSYSNPKLVHSKKLSSFEGSLVYLRPDYDESYEDWKQEKNKFTEQPPKEFITSKIEIPFILFDRSDVDKEKVMETFEKKLQDEIRGRLRIFIDRMDNCHHKNFKEGDLSGITLGGRNAFLDFSNVRYSPYGLFKSMNINNYERRIVGTTTLECVPYHLRITSGGGSYDDSTDERAIKTCGLEMEVLDVNCTFTLNFHKVD